MFASGIEIIWLRYDKTFSIESMRRSYSDASIVIVILFVVTDVGPTEICKDKVQQHLQEPFECELDECIQNQRKKLQII